jgi:hypothetical protein
MADRGSTRWGWLRLMYLYTIVGAGGVGVAILAAPAAVRTMFGWPTQDPIVLGVTGSVYVAFACLSVLGLRAPLQFAPVLLLQLCYKVVWFAALVLPMWLRGEFPAHGLLYVAIFATYVIGDVIAIPFRYLLAKPAAA